MGLPEAVETGGIDELVSLYVRINNAISGNEAEGIAPDPVLAEKARAEFHKMEMGDPDNIALEVVRADQPGGVPENLPPAGHYL